MNRTVAASAATVLLLTSAPAAAAAPGSTKLAVGYQPAGRNAVAVTLRCDPAGGGHPKKVRACRVLARAGGDPARLRPAPLICTLQYAPVTAWVDGTWRGRRVKWSHTFGNHCDMSRTTGALTAF